MLAGDPIELFVDVIAVLSLHIAFVLACLDCQLRRDRRQMPVVTTTSALAVLWMYRLFASSGLLPGLGAPSAVASSDWTLLLVNLVASSLLAVSLAHRSGRIPSYRLIGRAIMVGILVGLAGGLAARLAVSLPLPEIAGRMSVSAAMGGLALLPVGLACVLLLLGHRGDARILWSTLFGLGLTGASAAILLAGNGPETTLWNLAEVLSLLVAVSLLAGMLGLYPQSVRAEQLVQQERVVLLKQALEASEAERRRIARDLHDSAVQDLAAVSFSLAGTSRRLSAEGQDELASMLDQAAATTRETMAGLRSLIVDIYPPNLHKEGIETALADLCATARSRGLKVDFEVTPGLSMSEQASATIYRIAQEAVRNVLRHARATALAVSLVQNSGLVQLEVADDGRGFDRAHGSASGHLGLRLLSDLAREVGGRLEIRSSPGQGAVVRLEMIS